MANDKFLVTAAMAEMGWKSCQWMVHNPMEKKKKKWERLTIVGSVIGHCAARLIQLSTLPSYVS